jgi:hypothetical protein
MAAKYLLGVCAVLVIALGFACIAYGEADDSPGLQGIGVLLVIATVVVSVRAVRRNSRGSNAS